MMPKRLIFSIGPPTLPSFICWEKKAFLCPMIISENQRQQSSQTPETMMVGLSLSLVLPLLLHLASPAPAPAEDAKEVAQVHSPALGEVVQVLLQLEILFFFCFLIPWSCRSPMEASLRQREPLSCLTRSCLPCKRSTSFL